MYQRQKQSFFLHSVHPYESKRCPTQLKSVHHVSQLINNTGWIAIQRGEKINYDLENVPLQIMTGSVVGNNKQVGVIFYNTQGDYAGAVFLNTMYRPQYRLMACSSSWTSFLPAAIPSGTRKIWTIALFRSSASRGLTIACNGKEVLNVVVSGSMCTTTVDIWDDTWSDIWSRDVAKILFPFTHDTASAYFRPGIIYYC